MRLHEDIHNYYEKIVLEEIIKRKLNEQYNEDVMADFCCTVLNQLPPRYIRYDVDMAFYLPQTERIHMEERVQTAINVAISQISKKKELHDKST
ncbi:late competence development ComFB family protein [Pseudoalteromonas sp. SWXJZ94C]|uniref:late competence development ComFB family protein n=1 Tax=unclassified Pseudoalteromonas TaxID=194690 RepID=UPI000421AF2F|nr:MULTISPECIES: late competence development ComFB family protein [unclassified Pseudoalteromonas]MBH0055602.1 late competence development ComFB family protein [Pseudoalteromonas sp. SWXJZ94C]